MKTLIEAYALKQPRLSARAIHRNLQALAETHGEQVPSYRTVAKVIASIDSGLMMLAHEGSQVYSQAFDLLYRQESDAPNAVWQADHSVLDILILDENSKAKKPWLTIILDDYSRAIAGYFLSFQAPCAIHTALALRQAIWHKPHPRWQICGIPGVLYTDHGSDFTSKHIEQVAADLSIRLIFSQVGKPRGRGKIERFFQTLSQLLLCHLPGYAPAESRLSQKASLTLDQLDTEIHTFIVNHYLVEPHSTTGAPPAQRWEANGFLPQMPSSLEQLDLLLLNVAKPRIIHRDGIRLFGFRYISPTLAAFIGEEVTIRYDPRDIGEIRVFHNNTFVCRAICEQLSGQTFSLKEIIAARKKRKRELASIVKSRRSFIDALIPSKDDSPSKTDLSSASSRSTQKQKLKRYHNE